MENSKRDDNGTRWRIPSDGYKHTFNYAQRHRNQLAGIIVHGLLPRFTESALGMSVDFGYIYEPKPNVANSKNLGLPRWKLNELTYLIL